MPKQIKFNLIIDKKPIRDIEDLLDNFNIDDLLEAYQNGSLRRWLLVHDLEKELTELDKITGDTVETAFKLCSIFHADCKEDLLKQAAYSFDFRQKQQEKLEQLASAKNQRVDTIRSYHETYDILLLTLESQYDNYPYLKEAAIQIYHDFIGLFKLNLEDFYWRFIFDHPLVIFAVLANMEMRTLLTQRINEQEIYEHLIDKKYLRNYLTNRYKDDLAIPFLERCDTAEELVKIQNQFYSVFVFGLPTKSQSCSSDGSVKWFERTSDLVPPFIYAGKGFLAYPSHIKSFSGATEGYWKDVEGKGNWMILQMAKGNFIRNLGKNGEELKAEDVNGKFPILKGIDYKSNSPVDELIYMEV